MSKKALSLFQEESPEKRPKRKSRTTEYYKQRFRKNFAQLLEEEATQSGMGLGQQQAQPDDKKRRAVERQEEEE